MNTPSTQSPGGSAQQRVEVGFKFNCGNSHAEGNASDISKPPDGNQQNVPVSARPADGTDSMRQLVVPPDDSDSTLKENVDDTWMGYPCPMEEEIPENDSAV